MQQNWQQYLWGNFPYVGKIILGSSKSNSSLSHTDSPSVPVCTFIFERLRALWPKINWNWSWKVSSQLEPGNSRFSRANPDVISERVIFYKLERDDGEGMQWSVDKYLQRQYNHLQVINAIQPLLLCCASPSIIDASLITEDPLKTGGNVDWFAG